MVIDASTGISLVSTAIALMSLTISGITLFFAELRPPQLSSLIGPEIKIYYPSDGGFGLYIPATFLNQSPQTGTVLRCGVTIFRKVASEERYFMEWRSFARLGPDSKYFMEEPAHALAIPGNSSTVKITWLTWRAASLPKIQIVEGEYVLIFHYWDSATGKPHNELHEFYIDKSLYDELDGYRANKQRKIVDLVLDRNIAGNRQLNSNESRSLLGVG